jgi:hypothetical protein
MKKKIQPSDICFHRPPPTFFSLLMLHHIRRLYSILKSIELVEKLLELHATLPIAHLPKRYVCATELPNGGTSVDLCNCSAACVRIEVLEQLTHVSIFSLFTGSSN